MNFNKLIPELSVTNINVSKEFYTNLGFVVMYERTNDKFCFLEFEGNQIMIEQINDNWNVGKLEYPFGRGINISMAVSDVTKLYERVKKLDYKIFSPLSISKYEVNGTIYNDMEFLIQDPDGYLLRFNN